MTQYEIYQLTILLLGIFQWLTVPFAITHDAVRDQSTNYSTVWYFSVAEIVPSLVFFCPTITGFNNACTSSYDFDI
jgi:hypothetical protein